VDWLGEIVKALAILPRGAFLYLESSACLSLVIFDREIPHVAIFTKVEKR
jgi:hypothetical protein